jgi:hypothetical protein
MLLLKGPLIIGTDYAKYLCIKHNKVSVIIKINTFTEVMDGPGT